MRRQRLLVLVVCGLLSWGAYLTAEEKKQGPPKPGPEVKKLAYFVGTWNTEGEVKPNPMMPAGKMTSTDDCKWYPGGFFVVCNSKGNGPMGAVHSMGLLGYSTEDKAYTYSGIDSTGYAGHGTGSTDGRSWTYTSEDKMGGKVFHGRYTMSELSSDSYSFKYEMSEDGKTWNTVMEGKSTKAAPKPAGKKEAAPKK
jgi:hypothetical protein